MSRSQQYQSNGGRLETEWAGSGSRTRRWPGERSARTGEWVAKGLPGN